jgi:hypothetical protein
LPSIHFHYRLRVCQIQNVHAQIFAGMRGLFRLLSHNAFKQPDAPFELRPLESISLGGLKAAMIDCDEAIG